MSDNSAHPRPSMAPMSVSEYVEIQRQHGSCKEEFKSSVARCAKFGLAAGAVVGAYNAFAQSHRTLKLTSMRIMSTSLVSFVGFSGIGIIIASYNCLRVVR